MLFFDDWEHDSGVVLGAAAVENGASCQALARLLDFLDLFLITVIFTEESGFVRLHDVELAIVGQTFVTVSTLAIVTIVLVRQYLVGFSKFVNV